jgi:hypothetical protein
MGCRSDVECKGSRICENGQCVDPLGTGGYGGSGGFPLFGGAGGVPIGAGGFVFGGAGGFGPDASIGAQPGTGGSSCAAVRQQPESVVVYRDAAVTDTIYTYKPVALFLMIDRSGSMVTGSPPPADPNNWSNSAAAVTAFVNDSRSAGIDIGLGTFPYGSNNTADCASGSDCGNPVVPIAPLPGNAQAMTQAMNAQTPSSPTALTPTECGLRGLMNHCLQFMATSPTAEQCVAVLITDGAPTQCDTNQAYLANIVADGHSKGVTTFVLGLPGSIMSGLNALAKAGGTNAAMDVSGGAPAFIQALNDIRQAVAVSTTTTVTTPGVAATPVPCQWRVPPAPGGQPLDPLKLNVELTVPGGASQTMDYVASISGCLRTTGDGWYYDDAQNPTRILLCPNACLHVTSIPQASLDLLFGCATRVSI